MESADRMLAGPLNPKLENLFERVGPDPDTGQRTEQTGLLHTGLRRAEFALLSKAEWVGTEKIDGTSIRVNINAHRGSPEAPVSISAAVAGRTDKATIPEFVAEALERAFGAQFHFESELKRGKKGTIHTKVTRIPVFMGGEWEADYMDTFELDHLIGIADEGHSLFNCTIYGEAYGPGVQSGGRYGEEVRFRVFDIRVGKWWLNWDNVRDCAARLGLLTVPEVWRGTMLEMFQLVAQQPRSLVALADGGYRDLVMEGLVCRTNPLLLRRDGNRVMWKLKVSDVLKVIDRYEEFADALRHGDVSDLA